MSSVFKNAKCTGTLNVLGQTTLQNLVVNGTTTSVDSENVMITDNYLYLNKGYEGITAESGGIVVNYLPITANNTTVAVSGFTATNKVSVDGLSGFSAGDIIQINGTTGGLNDGIFVVLSHASNIITIDSTPSVKFANTAFTIETTSTGATIYNVNVGSVQVSATGTLEYASGSTQSAMTYSEIVTDGSVFALLAGRAGGQVLNGGTVSGEDLTLVPNSADLTGSVIVSGTDASTSTTTGAFTVAGGVGVAGDVFAGSLNSNTVDASTATTLSIGGTTATAVNISQAGDTTAVAGLLTVAESLNVTGTGDATVAFTAPVFDTDTAIALAIGPATATSVEIGATDADTTIKGAATVDGTTTFGSNVIETVAALSGASITGTYKALNTVTHTSAFTVTLPTAPADGTKLRFVNISANVCTITRGGSDTIENGDTTFELSGQFDRTHLTYIGGTWYTGL